MNNNNNNNNNNAANKNGDREREQHNRNADELVYQLETYFKKLKISYKILDDHDKPPEPIQKSLGCENASGLICIEHVHIDREITTVKDLLSLCDEFRVAENVRYNIDIASLHKICPYLRELDNMIGMQTIKTTVIDQIIYFIQRLHIPVSHSNPILSADFASASTSVIPICALKSTNPFQLPAAPVLFDVMSPQPPPPPPLFQYSNMFGEPNPSPNTPISISSMFSNLQPHSCKPKSGLGSGSGSGSGKNSTNKSYGDFMHTVLYGPPGTGKTEVAKILGNIFSHLGILKSNTFKKVTRSDLIAGYLGQTAIKTRDVINSAIGGVLFIDEAYALGNTEKRDSFSKECIDTLCEALSDHKHELMVIIAGYEKELTDCFFSYNEGLSSRFTWRYKIDNYNAVDLRKIFEKIVRDHRWVWSLLATDSIKDAWFKSHYEYFKYFGRDIEVFFTKTKIAHSRRIFCRPESEKRVLIMKDLECGFELFSQNEDIKMRGNSFQGSASTLYL